MIVVVKMGPTVQRRVEAGPTGCFAVDPLAPGSYRVTARLLGFDNVTRDDVVISAGNAARFDATMRVSTICECVQFGVTLLDRWKLADEVLHVRIAGPDARPAESGFYRHAAAVLSALKRSAGAPSGTVSLMQNQRGGTPDPYDPGQELVVFVNASKEGDFHIRDDEPGLSRHDTYPAMAFRIVDGRVQNAPFEFARFVGMRIEAFLQELRRLSKDR